MLLTNEFEVPLAPLETWILLTDLEKVAPCLPGAAITGRDGDQFLGRAKIKVGPITAEYRGVAEFVERDHDNLRAVLSARGKDARGQGDANANVTATLNQIEGGTRVVVQTDLAITGKAAQFGRGVIADISGALMGMFAERLREMVSAEIAGAPVVQPVAASTAMNGGAPTMTHAVAPPSTQPAETAPLNDEVLDVLALAGGLPLGKLLPKGAAAISVIAAAVSLVAAGYAVGRARSWDRR